MLDGCFKERKEEGGREGGREGERERERRTQIQKNGNEKYLSIITLNVNGLNAPTKRYRIAEQI